MSAIEVRVGGLAELGEALKGFSEKIGKKYLWKATLAAAAVFKAEAIVRVPVRSGALRDAIAVFRRKGRDASTAYYVVSVRKIRYSAKEKRVLRILRGANQRVRVIGDAYYGVFVEYGTSKMRAEPFLRPAFETKKTEALEVFRASLADGVAAATQESKR